MYMITDIQQSEKLRASMLKAKQAVLIDFEYQNAHGLNYEYNRALYLQSLNKYNKLTASYKAIIDLISAGKFRF